MEIKNLNLIPEGDKPIIHASQFDENRSVRFDLKDGTEDYTLLADLVVTCNIKKVDGNIVTFEVENTESTYVVITLPLQATACAGPNIGEIVITDEETNIIGTINFILEVERSPMLGGIESVSDIHDLEEQIEVIVTQVIATDYYTKTEVDNLLDDKADISDLPDMSDYYNKFEVNTLLANKADISDLPDMSNYYTKTEVDNKFLDIMPVNSASGSIANFTTSLSLPLVALKAYIQAQGGGGTPSAPVAITGVSEVNVTRAGKNLLAKPFIYNDNDDLDSLSECFFIKAGSYVASFDGMSNAINWRFIVRLKDANGNNLNTTDYVTFNSSMSWSATRKAWINNANTTAKNCIFTLNQDCYIRILFGIGNTSSSSIASNAQLELGSTRTDYVPYNADTFTLSLGQTCYGGYITQDKDGHRQLVVTYGYIASYNGETINKPWISSMDEYSQGATPTTGAQVVYPLTTPYTIALPDGEPINTLSGKQNIFADSGDIDVSFKQDIQNYVDSKTSALSANRTLSMIRPGTTEESKGDEDER